MKELEDLWKIILEKLELSVSNVSFVMWIKPLKIIDYTDDKTLVLSTKSTFAKNQLLRGYFDKIKNVVKEVFGEEIEIEILDPQEEESYLKNNKPKTKVNDTEEQKNPFDPEFTFDNFVVGKCNQYVYAAARAVAENPGRKINPLFIYGGVGLGKTHLLHSIGNYIREYKPNLKIKYVTCEQFTNDYIESLSTSAKMKTNSEFRSKYRNLDVLMVDDIQFIAKKTSTQEEFFHTFNELQQNGKQIIISSDRPPKEIETLEDRLRSRFTMGLIQDLQCPDLETRIAILRKKCQLEKYSVDDEAINYIAERVDSDIRELKGMLFKAYSLSSLLGKKTVDIFDARESFSDKYEEKNEGGSSAEQIIEAVCNYFNISKNDITGKKKNKEIVEPRMIAIYLINEMLEMPLVSIGKLFGGRDHTTIMHARDKIGTEVKSNKKTQTIINEIKKVLKSA
jgi:chromosomal replication initiator protein